MFGKKGNRKISVQVVPKSGKKPKAKSTTLTVGMTARQVAESLGISLDGKKLMFGGKPVAAGDVLNPEGSPPARGTVLSIEEHAQGS